MVTSHFCVKLTDGPVDRDVSVLFIHIVVSGSGLISENDAESFNVIWSSLKDFVHGENLSLGTLGLELTSQMVPEFGLSSNFISCEKSDSIYFGACISLGWLFSS